MIDLDQFHIAVKDQHFCKINIFEKITNFNLTEINILWNWKIQERKIIKEGHKEKKRRTQN